tara:strand:+ start:888 stop:1580 length:693 start_codon:yes stop_codon:yes gene_type:complete
MQLFYCPELLNDASFLSNEESSHCFKVLRKKVGDHIHLIDGIGGFYEAEITIASQKKVIFNVIKKWNQPQSPYSLHIAIAPTKNNDRFEWFLEKATEIGIDEVTPIICEHSERKMIKNDRMEKIIISAAKQSLKSKLPKINKVTLFNDFLNKNHSSHCFIAHCLPNQKKKLKNEVVSNSTILIGPEGDFSSLEVEVALKNNFIPISLGSSRLRTETAGVIACHTIALHHE